jgi:hypothetical protein
MAHASTQALVDPMTRFIVIPPPQSDPAAWLGKVAHRQGPARIKSTDVAFGLLYDSAPTGVDRSSDCVRLGNSVRFRQELS